MKKYIILFLVLMMVGLYIGYLYYENNQVLRDTSTQQVSTLLNEIESSDKDLNLSLMQMGYGIDNNYDRIVENVRKIKWDARKLRKQLNKAGFDTEKLLSTFTEYEEKNLLKMDLIENFKTSNSALLNSVNFAPFVGGVIAKELNQLQKDSHSNFVSEFNSQLILYIGSPNKINLNKVKEGIAQLETIAGAYRYEGAIGDQVSQYLIHVKHIVKYMEPTRIYLVNSTEVNTGSAIEKAQNEMQGEISVIQQKLQKLRKLLTTYLGFLAVVFIGLLIKMRQLFSGDGSPAVLTLNEKIAHISEQIQSPLKFLDTNLNNIDASYQNVQNTMGGLDDVVKEAKRTEKDSQRISAMVSTTLNDYIRLKSSGTMERTQNMIKGSSVGVAEIASLVAKLKEESDKEVTEGKR